VGQARDLRRSQLTHHALGLWDSTISQEKRLAGVVYSSILPGRWCSVAYIFAGGAKTGLLPPESTCKK
jgi:hypothetical protein